jgi:F0F1-type ATP synthase epsilon subunit
MEKLNLNQILDRNGNVENFTIDLIDIENKLNQAEERLEKCKNDEEKLQASENLQKLASVLKASAYF